MAGDFDPSSDSTASNTPKELPKPSRLCEHIVITRTKIIKILVIGLTGVGKSIIIQYLSKNIHILDSTKFGDTKESNTKIISPPTDKVLIKKDGQRYEVWFYDSPGVAANDTYGKLDHFEKELRSCIGHVDMIHHIFFCESLKGRDRENYEKYVIGMIKRLKKIGARDEHFKWIFTHTDTVSSGGAIKETVDKFKKMIQGECVNTKDENFLENYLQICSAPLVKHDKNEDGIKFVDNPQVEDKQKFDMVKSSISQMYDLVFTEINPFYPNKVVSEQLVDEITQVKQENEQNMKKLVDEITQLKQENVKIRQEIKDNDKKLRAYYDNEIGKNSKEIKDTKDMSFKNSTLSQQNESCIKEHTAKLSEISKKNSFTNLVLWMFFVGLVIIGLLCIVSLMIHSYSQGNESALWNLMNPVTSRLNDLSRELKEITDRINILSMEGSKKKLTPIKQQEVGDIPLPQKRPSLVQHFESFWSRILGNKVEDESTIKNTSRDRQSEL